MQEDMLKKMASLLIDVSEQNEIIIKLLKEINEKNNGCC